MSKKELVIVEQAKEFVPGFREGYSRFKQRIVLDQKSPSLLDNYGRYVAYAAIHFGKSPEKISIEEMNGYLYRLSMEEGYSETFFKFTVYGMRYWYRVYGLEDEALKMPVIRKKSTLPEVLSRGDVKRLIKAPKSLKHRFLLALVYSSGMRLNEVRLLKIDDLQTERRQILIRNGKGRKSRYVILSEYIVETLPKYLSEYNPQEFLFEGAESGKPMNNRSIQHIINEARNIAGITRKCSMHTLRHSFATHLLEEGVDIYSIQSLLGHAQLRTTIIYLHIAQVLPKLAHSPLDSLYGFLPKDKPCDPNTK